MPITMICPACGFNTSVRPPLYRCDNCNFPLQSKGGRPQQQQQQGRQQSFLQGQPNRNYGNQSQQPQGRVTFRRHINKKAKNEGRALAGWLIVHMNNVKTTSYELYEGENVFSKATNQYPIDLPIEDNYVGQNHARISISKDSFNRFRLVLRDDGAGTGRPSASGTFINGINKRIPGHAQVFLKDRDLIQVGYTNLVFKSVETMQSEEDAVRSVLDLPFPKVIR